MASESNAIHLLAGGIGGTTGAVITCPLEVVKTRLQSSIATFQAPQVYVSNVAYVPQTHIVSANFCTACVSKRAQETVISTASQPRSTTNLFKCLRFIIQHEGARALFKGLGPNLIGVAPSRAIYFCAYAQTKQFCNSVMIPETPLVHICSAASAGFTASTATNPIWYIKTRLQLDQRRHGSLTVMQCIRNTYNTLGIPGFYKGITASYFGISETVIHFVIYEGIKAKLREMKGQDIDDDRCAMDFLEFMGAGAVSKTVATIVAYPHEVVRTRLRQEGNKYRGFIQTLGVVFREEGMHGLYRGLTTQLVRQIPNTAIMMSTYEAVVYLFSKY